MAARLIGSEAPVFLVVSTVLYRALVLASSGHLLPEGLPPGVRDRIQVIGSIEGCTYPFQVALVEASTAHTLRPLLASRIGALIGMIDTTEEGVIPLWRLVAERALCVNTTAAGGNASLMTLGLE